MIRNGRVQKETKRVNRKTFYLIFGKAADNEEPKLNASQAGAKCMGHWKKVAGALDIGKKLRVHWTLEKALRV